MDFKGQVPIRSETVADNTLLEQVFSHILDVNCHTQRGNGHKFKIFS